MYFARSIRGLLVALLTAAAVAAFARTVRAQAPDVGIEIILHEGTELEERGRRQLLRLLSEYDLEPWIFTDTVLIRSRVVPHSHPVLTLNTRYLDDDLRQLSAFVHEQIHWFEAEHDAASDAAIDKLRERYPDVPVGRPDGGRDEGSTYLHLIVCWLELDAMERLIGEERARELLAGKDYYRWIYARVLEDTEAIGDILAEHGLLIGTSQGVMDRGDGSRRDPGRSPDRP